MYRASHAEQAQTGGPTLTIVIVAVAVAAGTVALVAMVVVLVVVIKRASSRTPEVETAMNSEESAEQQYGTKP